MGVKEKLPRVSFKENVKKYCISASKDWYMCMLSKFLYFQLFDDNGESKCDYVIIYDKLEDGLYKLCSKFYLKMPNLNNKRNVTKNKNNYKNYYDTEDIGMINKKCELELKMFNFTFEG
jgi:hypothetical protein